MKNCQLCFIEFTEKNPPEYSSKLYELCSKYLHPSFLQEDLLLQAKNKCLAFCGSCSESGKGITRLSEQLDVLQKSIAEFGFIFSLEILHRRGKSAGTIGNFTVTNINSKKVIIEFDVSSPTNGKAGSIPTLDADATSASVTNNLEETIVENFDVDDFEDPLILPELIYNENGIDIVAEVKFDLENPVSNVAGRVEIPEIIPGTRNVKIADRENDLEENENPIEVDFRIQTPMLKLHRLKFHGNGENCIVANGGCKNFKCTNEPEGKVKSTFWAKSDSQSSYKIVEEFAANDKRNRQQKSQMSSSSTIIQRIGEQFRASYDRLLVSIEEDRLQSSTETSLHKSHSNQAVAVEQSSAIASATTSEQFHCAICDKSFETKNQLNVHRVTHRKRPFKCNVCNKRFVSKRYMKKHVMWHTVGKERPIRPAKAFKCPICDKLFTDKCNMKRHTILHTGKKPFKCDECDHATTQRSHLQIHKMYKHSNKRHFKCKDCDRTFKTAVAAKAHYKRAHFALEFSKDSIIKLANQDKNFPQSNYIEHF